MRTTHIVSKPNPKIFSNREQRITLWLMVAIGVVAMALGFALGSVL